MLYRIVISLYINFLELLASGYSIDLQNLNEGHENGRNIYLKDLLGKHQNEF